MVAKYSIDLQRILLAIEQRIAVAESLTGGHLQAIISSVSGSSEYFDGGVTAYNIEQKVSLLNVARDHATSVNGVSERVAEEMAAGVREMFGSFVGLSTTGYAESSPEWKIDAPFAYYAINLGGWITTGRIEGGSRSRVAVQTYVAETVVRRLIEAFDRLEHLEQVPEELAVVRQRLRTCPFVMPR